MASESESELVLQSGRFEKLELLWSKQQLKLIYTAFSQNRLLQFEVCFKVIYRST